MKVKFKENKDIEFIDDNTISVNDFMAHRLMVKVERLMSIRETLWVRFQSKDLTTIVSNEAMMQREFADGEEWYVLLIPDSVTSVVGEWEFELRVKRLNTVTQEFEFIYASNPAAFSVADGLSGFPNKVTNETIASLYSTAQEAVKALENIPEITTEDEGKFLRVVDGKWQAASVPIAETQSF